MQNRLPEKIERCISDSGKVESGENIGVTLVVALFKLRQIGDKQFEHIVFVLFFCLNRSEQTVHRMNDLAVHQTEQFFDFIFLLLSVCRAGKIEAEILEHSRQIVHIGIAEGTKLQKLIRELQDALIDSRLAACGIT